MSKMSWELEESNRCHSKPQGVRKGQIMPCLAEQSLAGWELQEQYLRQGNSLVSDIRCKGGGAMGSHMSNNKENCLARALAPAESLALSQEKWVGGTRYQLHNSQWHIEAGGSRDGQELQDKGSRGRLPAAGDGERLLCG